MFEGVKIAGLYKQKRKKDGKTYLTGKLNYQSRLLILPNEKKQADNEPDFNVFLVPIEEKPKPTAQPQPEAQPDADDF